MQGLATGNYYFYVVGFDAVGNQSPLSVPAPVYFDAVPPSFTVAYDKPSPVGVGPVQVTISSSEGARGDACDDRPAAGASLRAAAVDQFGAEYLFRRHQRHHSAAFRAGRC